MVQRSPFLRRGRESVYLNPLKPSIFLKRHDSFFRTFAQCVVGRLRGYQSGDEQGKLSLSQDRNGISPCRLSAIHKSRRRIDENRLFVRPGIRRRLAANPLRISYLGRFLSQLGEGHLEMPVRRTSQRFAASTDGFLRAFA
jgi:hypothetical protein